MRASSNLPNVNKDNQLPHGLKEKKNSRMSVNENRLNNQRSKVGGGADSQQPTVTSDFMNRFKGKITTMNKDGHLGIV